MFKIWWVKLESHRYDFLVALHLKEVIFKEALALNSPRLFFKPSHRSPSKDSRAELVLLKGVCAELRPPGLWRRIPMTR